MSETEKIQNEFETVIQAAYTISEEIGQEVENVLKEGRERPLEQTEAFELLKKVLTTLKASAISRGDKATTEELQGDIETIINRIVSSRERASANGLRARKVILQERNGIKPNPIFPRPTFHEREVPMNGGFVKTADIELWNENARLDVHLGQFHQQHGRKPNHQETLDIMLGRSPLPGVDEDDQFEILQLARSISNNGVRKPPIIDTDGTLLDGNRRLSACNYILNSDEFDSEQKKRAEYIYVWQLTEHATEDERNAVIVSLNFEPDCKEDWPEYVKAKKVYEEWQTMLTLEPRSPNTPRLQVLKRELSKKFGYGPHPDRVNRYLKMVEWADDFEEYHKNVKHEPKFEVKHRANKYFQYFEELSKGTNPGGVAHTLNQDEGLKHLVFDLLYQGKIENWTWIRNLKHTNDEVRTNLIRARNDTDRERGADIVETALTEARNRNRESRLIGANTRIDVFVKWLEDLPISSFRNEIRPDSLQKLLSALELVKTQAEAVVQQNAP